MSVPRVLLQILYEETLFQKGPDGRRLVEQLTDVGVLLGIKVDLGVQPLPGTEGETTVQVRPTISAVNFVCLCGMIRCLSTVYIFSKPKAKFDGTQAEFYRCFEQE